MGRRISERLTVTGELVASSPLHIGGASDDLAIDMPAAMNGEGQVYIPGTSLAGALASWWESQFGRDDLELVWGIRASGPPEFASRITIADACAKGDPFTELRDGVGIDRHTGAAAAGIKYDREVISSGQVFDFRLVLELEGAEEERKGMKARLRAMLVALENGEIRLGAAKTRGLGTVRLKDSWTAQCSDYGSLAKLINSIEDRTGRESLPAAAVTRQTDYVCSFTWEAALPTFVANGMSGLAIDIIPLTARTENGKVQMVLPGSSMKGVFRTHAERIVRTLQQVEPRRLAKQGFLDQTEGLPLVEQMFGSRNRKHGGTEEAAPTGRGAVYFDDARFGDAVDSKVVDKLLALDKGAKEDKDRLRRVRELLSKSWPDHLPYQHVAIDRWTGGAADGALYAVLDPPQGLEVVSSCRVERSRLGEQHEAALGFLLVLLREAAEGRMPFGFGVNRGRGSLNLKKVSISGPEVNLELDGTALTSGSLVEGLRGYVDAWIAFANRVSARPSTEPGAAA